MSAKNGLAPTPPEDPAAERALLGSILLAAREVMPQVRTLVEGADFTRMPHRLVYEAMGALMLRDDAVDFGTVYSEMQRRNTSLPAFMNCDLDAIGGSQFLVGLMAEVPHHLNARTYAKRVHFVATARALLGAANAAATIAYNEGGPANDGDAVALISAALEPFQRIVAKRAGGKIVSADQAAHSYYATMAQRMDKDESIVGFNIGFRGLDRYVAYRAGELMYVSAAVGVGKTALLGTLCEILGDRGVPCLFVSIEQPLPQLMDRIMAGKTSLDSWKLARGDITDEQFQAFSQALDPVSKRPIYYLEDGALTTVALDAQVQYAVARFGVRVVFIDYVQLLADQVGEGKAEQIAFISGRLRQMARRYDIQIVAASQVSKEGNLRWAQELRQDASVILHLERDRKESAATIRIEKNRNGMAGVEVPAHFDFESAHYWPRREPDRRTTAAREPEQAQVPF